MVVGKGGTFVLKKASDWNVPGVSGERRITIIRGSEGPRVVKIVRTGDGRVRVGWRDGMREGSSGDFGTSIADGAGGDFPPAHLALRLTLPSSLVPVVQLFAWVALVNGLRMTLARLLDGSLRHSCRGGVLLLPMKCC